MIIPYFCVKDDKTSFLAPFPAVNEGDALRRFIATVRSSTPNSCNTYPEDKSLYYVGSFDDEDGVFKPIKKPKFLANAISYIVQREQQSVPVVPAPAEGGKNEDDV